MLPAAATHGDPVRAAALGTRTLSQRIVQAISRAPLFFSGVLGGLTGVRSGDRDDRKPGPVATRAASVSTPGSDADDHDDVASDVRTEASGLSRGGRHPTLSETRLDASTSLGYQLSELPEAHDLGVLDEVFGQPQASIVKGYASQPLQLYEAGEGCVSSAKQWQAALKPGDAVMVGPMEVVFRRFTRLDGVLHLTMDTARPEKKDGDDLRYQQLCEEPGAVPAGDGLVHLPVPGTKPGV